MFRRRDRIVRSLVSTRMLVFPANGGAFDGLLVDVDHRTLRFADVHHRSDGISTPAPGELVIERDPRTYFQVVSAEQPVVG